MVKPTFKCTENDLDFNTKHILFQIKECSTAFCICDQLVTQVHKIICIESLPGRLDPN